MHRALDLAKAYITEFQKNDLPGLAAELAYRFLFAVFPFGLFVAALTAFVAQAIGLQDPTGQIMGALGDNLPPDIANGIRPELERVIGEARPGLLSLGAIAALWSATGGTNALIKGLNRAFEVEDTRSFIHKTALAIGLTLLATIGILGAFVTIVGGSFLTDQVAAELGLSSAWATISLVRWPLVGVLLTLAVAVLVRYAPDLRPSWRWCLLGAAVFTVGWLLLTALFALYVTNVANFGATYGALGGVIALMLWFYLTALLLTASAQLAAVLMRAYEPDRLRELQTKTPTAAASPVAVAADPPRPPTRPRAPLHRPLADVHHRDSSPADAARAGGVVILGAAVGALVARLLGRDDDETAAT